MLDLLMNSAENGTAGDVESLGRINPEEANRRHGLEITSKTADCFWDGERMDLHMAVDVLLTHDDADQSTRSVILTAEFAAAQKR
jgi:hypothetical protein